MITLIQRVTPGKVTIHKSIYSKIGAGYVILLGIFEEDTEKDIEKIINKIINMRIMPDNQGKMNKSILDTGGEALIVSQFTLCADLSAGRRPSFIKAKNPREAERLYEHFAKQLEEKGISTQTGKFAANMQVEINNDGPVTIIVDSNNL